MAPPASTSVNYFVEEKKSEKNYESLKFPTQTDARLFSFFTHVNHQGGDAVADERVPGIGFFTVQMDHIVRVSLVQPTDAVVGDLETIYRP